MFKTNKGLFPIVFAILCCKLRIVPIQHIDCFFCENGSFFFVVDGFLFLMLGTALYNELLIIPPLMPKPESPQVTRKVRLFRLKELW